MNIFSHQAIDSIIDNFSPLVATGIFHVYMYNLLEMVTCMNISGYII